MEVSLLLADAATININGNLDSLGLGWSVTGPAPLPGFVLIIIVKVPLNWQDGDSASLSLGLFDMSGELVSVSGNPSAKMSLDGRLQFPGEVDSPSGVKRGVASIIGVPAGLTLAPGTYEWIVSVDGVSQPSWRVPFYVRSTPDEFPAKVQQIPVAAQPSYWTAEEVGKQSD